MALIKCPECNNDMSDRAEICPHCGYPLTGWDEYDDENTYDPATICPECNQEITDGFECCPYCGYPLTGWNDDKYTDDAECLDDTYSEIYDPIVPNTKIDEEILLVCNPEFEEYIFPILILSCGIYVSCVKSIILGVILFAIGIKIILSLFYKISISSCNIYLEKGILTKTKLSLPISTVTSVTVESSILGRISNYGTIQITYAQGVLIFKNIVNAIEFKNIFDQVRGSLDWH